MQRKTQPLQIVPTYTSTLTLTLLISIPTLETTQNQGDKKEPLKQSKIEEQ